MCLANMSIGIISLGWAQVWFNQLITIIIHGFFTKIIQIYPIRRLQENSYILHHTILSVLSNAIHGYFLNQHSN